MMTENPSSGHIVNPDKGDGATSDPSSGHIVNPNEDGGATSDPNWHGDMGDQGNDIRFAEEQALINAQAGGADGDSSKDAGATEGEGNYTSEEPAGTGGYTDRDGR